MHDASARGSRAFEARIGVMLKLYGTYVRFEERPGTSRFLSLLVLRSLRSR